MKVGLSPFRMSESLPIQDVRKGGVEFKGGSLHDGSGSFDG